MLIEAHTPLELTEKVRSYLEPNHGWTVAGPPTVTNEEMGTVFFQALIRYHTK